MPDQTATSRRRRSVALVLGGVLVAGTAGAAGAFAASQATASSVSLGITPGSLSVSAGDQGVYDVAIKRKSFTGSVALSVTGLPAGATGAFASAPTTGDTSKLTVTTTPGTALGTFTFVVTSTSSLGTSTANAKLTVGQAVQSPKSFTIGGNLTTGLAPGSAVPLDLILTNPNNQAISVTNLNVTVAVATKPNATTAKPCTAADFAVTQMAAGSYPVPVPANSTRTLSQSLASSAWPQARMLDTSANQDGCKGATLTLTYTGTAQGGN